MILGFHGFYHGGPYSFIFFQLGRNVFNFLRLNPNIVLGLIILVLGPISIGLNGLKCIGKIKYIKIYFWSKSFILINFNFNYLFSFQIKIGPIINLKAQFPLVHQQRQAMEEGH